MCFVHCADNFFTRQLSVNEESCLDKCIDKFSNVNQRVMAAYVHDQAIINERRMKEMEQQMKANEAAALSAATAAVASVPPESIPESSNAAAIEPITPIVMSSVEALNQNQSENVST